MAVGKEGDVIEGDARKLADILKKKNDKNLQVQFQYFPDENHATILHWAVYKAFQIFKLKK